MNVETKDKMIFVVGNSRSGTTMMGRILGKHPDIFTFHELHFFGELWSSKDSGTNITKTAAINLIANLLSIQREGYLNSKRNPKRFIAEAEIILNKTKESYTKEEVFSKMLINEASLSEKSIPCDQTPRNLFYVEDILALYPEAKIINMVRDPRNVLLSQKNKWKRRYLGAKNIPFKEAIRAKINYHPITISKLWQANINHMKSFEGNSSVLTIKFEKLLETPEGMIKKTCDFLEIDYFNEMLNIPQVGSSSGKDKKNKTGINKDRLHAYKKGGLGEEEVEICQKITQQNMARYDYQLQNVVSNPFKKYFLYITFPFKVSLALLMNLKRMNNVIENIKRRL